MNTGTAVNWLLRVGMSGAVAGRVASIYGYVLDAPTFFSAWLSAFYFWISMPLGALALLLIGDLTGGSWEKMARTPLSAMAATMPLFVLLFLPIVAGLDQLYPWARPEVAAKLPNRWYLNITFFYVRAIVYFLIWNGLVTWRLFQSDVPHGNPRSRAQWPSAIGLLLMLYTITYAGIDWILSTEPPWFSSIFGMIACSSRLIASISLAALLMIALPSRDARGFSKGLASLAAILLAAIIFWMYAEFSQWLIVWEENLHSEIHWYLERWRAPWSYVIYTLVVVHFAAPFTALVWGPTKRNPRIVGPVCVLVLVANMIYVWWLLLPGFTTVGFSWMHPAVMIGMGGIWLLLLAAALSRMSGGGPLPVHEGLTHG